MNWLREVARRLRMLMHRRQFDADLEEEIRLHLELRQQEHLESGMTVDDARAAARRRFGNVTSLREKSRIAWGWEWFEHLVQDVRYGLRMLRKSPGFAAVAVFTLALGIGATVAIFAFADAALIKPLPYEDPNRLVGVTESIAMFPRANLSYPDYLDWEKLNTVFSSMDVWTGTGFLLATPSGKQTALGARVSDGFFRTLGITPMLGRNFVSGEDLLAAPRTVMLSYEGWQKWFGRRTDVLGQAITLSDDSYTIIGVLPRDFQFAPRAEAEFWTTLHASGSCDLRRSCHTLDGIARLKNGISVQTALADMKSIAAQLEKEYPDSNRGQSASVMPLSDVIVGDIRPILLVLLGGAVLLLLIACVNVTSLLLVRSETRKREIAVRQALGASSRRLVRQFATEGLLLVAIGSTLGLVSAKWVMQLLTSLIPAGMMAGMPFLQGLGLNFHVLSFACAVSLLAAAVFSFIPLSRLSFSEMREGLTEGGRGSAGTVWRRFGSNLVVLELATAMVLLVGAGLLGKSFYRLLHVDIGFQPDHLAVLYVVAPQASYGKDEQAVALARQVVSRISNLPGVKSVGIASRVPLSGNGNTDWIRFVGRSYHGEHNEVNQRNVSSAYFTTLQAKLLRGRYFVDMEDATKPNVVIINQALARVYFPGEDPIGKRIGDDDLTLKSIKEIIGIVDDINEGSLDSEVLPTVYYPFNQTPDTFFGVVVRTSQAEQSMFSTLDATIHQIDPDIGIGGQSVMTQRISDSQSAYLHRSSAWLVGGFATLALLLGVLGLYGVTAYSVSQRTREIGVRMALGAQRKSVYQLILVEAARLIGAGIVVGLVCSVAAARLVRGMLFGVQPGDIPTLAAVAAVLAVSALVASYIPARRAMSVDPTVALRYE
jgi:macrolide transport system ATP-binding/permease protein